MAKSVTDNFTDIYIIGGGSNPVKLDIGLVSIMGRALMIVVTKHYIFHDYNLNLA